MRQPDNKWLLSETSNIQAVVELPRIDCRPALAEVYDKVEQLAAG